MKRVFYILATPLFAFLLLSSLWSQWGQPRIEEYLKGKINSTKIPGTLKSIQIDKVGVQLFPPRVGIQGNEIFIFTNKTLETTQKINIQKIELSANAFLWLIGQFKAVHLSIEEMKIQLNLDQLNSEGPSKELPLADLFELLKKIPLVDIELVNSEIQISSELQGFIINLKNVNSKIDNKEISLQQKMSIEKISFQNKLNKELNGSFNGLLSLTPEQLTIQNILIKLNLPSKIQHGP